MQFGTRIRWLGGAAAVAVSAVTTPACGQPASATLRVTAEVVDVGGLATVPFDSEDSVPGTGSASVASSASAFSITPPRFSDVAVSVLAPGLVRAGRGAAALQVCSRSSGITGCRRVPLGAAGRAALAASAGGEPLLVRFPAEPEPRASQANATITLAYTAS